MTLMDYSKFNDHCFSGKVILDLVIDDQAFDAWLAADSLDASIDVALAAGKAAAKAGVSMSEADDLRGTLVAIDLSHVRSKPLVQALARRGIGRPEILPWTYEISIRDVMGPRFKPASDAQVNTTLKAFALALSHLGFEMQILVG